MTSVLEAAVQITVAWVQTKPERPTGPRAEEVVDAFKKIYDAVKTKYNDA